MKMFVSFKTRLLMGYGLIILLMIGLTGIALWQFTASEAALKELRDKVSPQAWAAEKIMFDIVQVQQFLTDVSATQDPEGLQDAEAFANDFKNTMKQLHQYTLSPEQEADMAAVDQAFEAFYQSGKSMTDAFMGKTIDQGNNTIQQKTDMAAVDQAFDAFYQAGKSMANDFMHKSLEKGNIAMEKFDKASLDLTGRMSIFKEKAKYRELSIVNNLAQKASETAFYMWMASIFGTLVSVWIAIYLTRYLGKQLGVDPYFAKGIAQEIAKGNLERNIDIDANDKSSLLYAMKQMQGQILNRITAANKLIDEVTRVKIALDNVSTGVMIADNERTIIYVNNAVVNLLSKIEPDIKKHLPNFSVASLVGNNIDLFHKNPAHQATQIAAAKDSFKSTLVLHGHHLVITASPVIDQEGRRLGTAAEWVDRTDEKAVETQVAAAINAAVSGDFTYRIDSGELQGFYEQAAKGVNQLMQVCNDGLNDVVRVLSAMAQGDLTETIANEYSGTFGQLKENTNTTTEKLKEVVGQIMEASESIHTAAKEIAAGNNDLSYRTEQQAASLEQTAASMEELTSTVQANSENAKHANQLAVGATDIAGKGVKVVGQVVSTMEGINDSSRKVVDIISVIDSIAFQTNILALNAAVEAARAGEQGRGFAVVAVEVRNLAQRAAAAAAEIKGLISDSVERVEDGSKLVAQAGLTMEEIVSAIRGVTTIMSEISAASMEQTSGIEQVNQAIGQMEDVTQQNAALVEQAAASAESLEEQTQNLAVTMAYFKLDDNSRGASGVQVKAGSSFGSAPPRMETAQARGKSPVVAKPKPQSKPVASDEWEGR